MGCPIYQGIVGVSLSYLSGLSHLPRYSGGVTVVSEWAVPSTKVQWGCQAWVGCPIYQGTVGVPGLSGPSHKNMYNPPSPSLPSSALEVCVCQEWFVSDTFYTQCGYGFMSEE